MLERAVETEGHSRRFDHRSAVRRHLGHRGGFEAPLEDDRCSLERGFRKNVRGVLKVDGSIDAARPGSNSEKDDLAIAPVAATDAPLFDDELPAMDRGPRPD